MFDEPFALGSSLVHRLDPRARLIMAAAFAVGLAVVRHAGVAEGGLLLAAGVLLASRPPLGPLVRRVAVVNVFILFLWLTVPLTTEGQTLWSVGPLTFSREGVALAWLVTLKSNAILLAFLALVASMDAATLGHALATLGLPAKLVFLFLFTYRYLHVIAVEWRRLRTAARLRGFVPRTGGHTYRTVGHLLAMVLVNSFDRSNRVYQAMVLRGFAGRFRSVVRFQARPLDWIVVLFFLIAVLGLFSLDRFPEVMGV